MYIIPKYYIHNGAFDVILCKGFLGFVKRRGNMRATRIKMHNGMEKSNSVLEIKEIYITGQGNEKYFLKEEVYDFLVKNPRAIIEVNIAPYPKLVPATKNGQKYVRSEPNDSINDNLLKLPRY